MPVHDWARVEAGIFHDFHNCWLAEMRNILNGGLLPPPYYALTEQHAGRFVVDLLTLQGVPPPTAPPLPADGGLAVAEAPPRARRKLTADATARQRRRSLAIRHVTGHRLVALVDIVSLANKDRRDHIQEFADKVTSALELGIHVLLVDLFPPGLHDPRGMHGAIWEAFDDEPYEVPTDEPLTLTSYVGGLEVQAYVEHLAVGNPLPAMALFLGSDRYVNVPLEETYQASFRGVPAIWRAVLEDGTA